MGAMDQTLVDGDATPNAALVSVTNCMYINLKGFIWFLYFFNYIDFSSCMGRSWKFTACNILLFILCTSHSLSLSCANSLLVNVFNFYLI